MFLYSKIFFTLRTKERFNKKYFILSQTLFPEFQKRFFFNHLPEDSYIVHDHIDASFLFLLQRDFYIAHEHIGDFCLFLLHKDFDIFHILLFEAFLCVFDNRYLSFLYIVKKIKNILSVFLYALKIDFTIWVM